GRTGQAVVAGEDIRVRRAVEHVVGERGVGEAGARLAAPGEPERARRLALDVDSVASRGDVEGRAGAGMVDVRPEAGREHRLLHTAVVQAAGVGVLPHPVVVLALVLETPRYRGFGIG